MTKNGVFEDYTSLKFSLYSIPEKIFHLTNMTNNKQMESQKGQVDKIVELNTTWASRVT